LQLYNIYTVGVARSLCRRLLYTRHSNRKLSTVMAFSTTFLHNALWKLPN